MLYIISFLFLLTLTYMSIYFLSSDEIFLNIYAVVLSILTFSLLFALIETFINKLKKYKKTKKQLKGIF